MVKAGNSPYPPISNYGYIADCHSSALVSTSGSIDWCCMPRLDSGSCFGRLLDCFTMRRGGRHDPHQQILRVIEGIRGRMEFILEIVPCFDYGTTKAWIRSYKEDHYMAIGGNDGLLISTDFHCKTIDRHSISGFCTVKEGHRITVMPGSGILVSPFAH
jgi:GH15 family glucan-1,4-alpha-glucosidase